MSVKAMQNKTDFSKENLIFREKNVEIVNNGVKLFFKETKEEQYYLIHVRDGKRFKSYWECESEVFRDIYSGKSLAASNSALENKLVQEAYTFANEHEVRIFLDEAGKFVKRHNNEIFPFKDDFKRFVGSRRDTELKEKMIADKEGMEWLIYVSINAYKKIQETGWSEDAIDEIRLEYLKESNPTEYAARQLFTITEDPEDFISRKDIVSEIDEYIELEEGLIKPYNTPHVYYGAIRNIGAEEAQKRIDGNKVHGFRYIMGVRDRW